MRAKDLLEINRPPTMLIYGPAGTGKTAIVSQAVDGYMMDFDDGMRTALTLNDQFTPLRQSIEFDLFVDEDPMAPRKYLEAKTKLLQISDDVRRGKWPYKAIVIDSLTGLCRAAQLFVLGTSGNSMRQPQIQHFGQIVNEVESIFTILRSLKVLVLVTAHEMAVETDNGMLIRIMSATKPHGMNKIPWLFDEVLYAKTRMKGGNKPNDYIVSGKSSSSISTRTRSGITSDIVINDIGLAGLLDFTKYKEHKEKEETNVVSS